MAALCASAAAARRARDRVTNPGEVTFIVDRNVNYTNFCVTDCDFCAFYRPPGDGEGYVLPQEAIFAKLDELVTVGGSPTEVGLAHSSEADHGTHL